MYTVILVDDEPVVREGLEYIIDWEKEDFKIIGSASNGIEGLKEIEEKQPDLVITDIKMPGLNGLEMVEKAKKCNGDTKFIILSGYSDFKYAQNAISLGTLHYLLKPIDETELIKILGEVRKQLKNAKKEQKSKRHYEDYLTNQSVFYFVINGENNKGKHLLEKYESYQLIKISKNQTKIDKQHLMKSCRQIDHEECLYYTHGDDLLLLMGDGNAQKLDEIVSEIISQTDYYMMVSSVTTDIDQVPVLYKEVQRLEEYRYYYPNDRIIFSKDVETKKIEEEPLDKLLVQLKMAIKENNKATIESVIDRYVSFFRSSNEKVEIVKREWSVLFMECVTFLEESMQKPVKEIEKDKILSIIWKEQSITQTVQFLKYIFYDFGRFFYQTNEKQDIVEQIKHYSAKNYHLNLSLKELAQEFNYSQSYLGKKFKTDMAMSYHVYLDKLRLEKAKQLLEDDSYYIYEIAKMIGYSNYDYFHKKFKKRFGLSPKEYQKEWKGERGE